MATSRAEEMVKRLREMQAATPEIVASAIVSVDGLTIASALPTDVEEDRVSAMSAAMLSLGERIATELNRDPLCNWGGSRLDCLSPGTSQARLGLFRDAASRRRSGGIYKLMKVTNTQDGHRGEDWQTRSSPLHLIKGRAGN
jgi:hypothetical protein